jgi:hypothetical protein
MFLSMVEAIHTTSPKRSQVTALVELLFEEDGETRSHSTQVRGVQADQIQRVPQLNAEPAVSVRRSAQVHASHRALPVFR